MIYYDISEGRSNSRVKLTDIGQAVIGLEAATGADMLVTPLDDVAMPNRVDLKLLPHQMVMGEHCAAGWLVARKSGQDLVTSVPALTSEVLPRMQKWSQSCWLLSTGNYGINRAGNVMVSTFETGMHWNAFNNALIAWSLDGGYFAQLAKDDQVGRWLIQVNSLLTQWHKEGGRPDKIVFRQPTRDVYYEHDNCAANALAALPGIGQKKAKLLLEHFGSAATALEWLTRPELFSSDRDDYPKGIGLKTIQKIKDCLGGSVERSNWRNE